MAREGLIVVATASLASARFVTGGFSAKATGSQSANACSNRSSALVAQWNVDDVITDRLQ